MSTAEQEITHSIPKLLQLGQQFQNDGELIQAEETYNLILELEPLQADALSHLGIMALQIGQYDTACELFQHAIDSNGHIAEYHNNLGNIYKATGRTELAIACYKKAVRLKPDYAVAYTNMGLALRTIGEINAARKTFTRAIKADPSHAGAWYYLSHSQRFSHTDRNKIKKIISCLSRAEAKSEQAMFYNFALAKIYDDCGEFENAFQHYQCANDIKYMLIEHKPEFLHTHLKRLKNTFSREIFEKHSAVGLSTDLPVFIIGMPRSGTTLVEQIISSHPEVYGAGEIRFFTKMIEVLNTGGHGPAMYPESIPLIEPSGLRAVANKYIDLLNTLSQDARRITDKMPYNFLHLGLIALLFPHCRIIHCRRGSLATGLSIYFQFFSEAQSYAYNLSEIGAYYHDYEILMAHWHEVLPIPIIEVEYEELVSDQERVSRNLIKAIGLEWDDSCLDFHQSEREVRTASNWQVRQPLYKTSIDRWKNYEKFLTPFKQQLEGAAE